MKLVARLVVRDDNSANLILGGLGKDQSFFKKGRVYEITDVLGEISIREIGCSWIKQTLGSKSLCWAHDVSSLLERCGKLIFLTEDEYQEQCGLDEELKSS